MPDLPGGAEAPGVWPAIENQAAADAGAEPYSEHVVVPFCRARQPFTEQPDVGVITGSDGNAERLPQVGDEIDVTVPVLQVRYLHDPVPVHRAGNTDPDGKRLVLERLDKLDDGRDDIPGAGLRSGFLGPVDDFVLVVDQSDFDIGAPDIDTCRQHDSLLALAIRVGSGLMILRLCPFS